MFRQVIKLYGCRGCLHVLALRHVQVASMECVRGSLAAVGLDNKLYAMGGGEPNVNQDTVEVYDAHHNAWLPGPTMNNRRFTTAAALHNSSIFVSGGYDGTQYLKSVERLDPREGKWQLVRHLPVLVTAASFFLALLLIRSSVAVTDEVLVNCLLLVSEQEHWCGGTCRLLRCSRRGGVMQALWPLTRFLPWVAGMQMPSWYASYICCA